MQNGSPLGCAAGLCFESSLPIPSHPCVFFLYIFYPPPASKKEKSTLVVFKKKKIFLNFDGRAEVASCQAVLSSALFFRMGGGWFSQEWRPELDSGE